MGMTTSAIQHLERAAQLDDIGMMKLEIAAALGSLKQQPKTYNLATITAPLERAVARFPSAAAAAGILHGIGMERVPAGITLYREI